MISLSIGDCKVDILPVVNGLESETEKVRSAYGGYEAYGIPLGVEGIQALKDRVRLEDEFEVSELDIAYANKMFDLTGEEVVMPSPAMCTLVDLVTEGDGNVIALDMNDAQFTDMYCDTVSAFDFVKEHGLAKKGMKRRFSSDTPEAFALEWDAFVNTVKGYRKVSEKREEFIAAQIRDVARYRKSLLVVMEIERAEGVARLLR